MPELIDRQALLKKVYEHPQERERMTDGEWCRKCIYEAPKVEAEPVRHGRWIKEASDMFDCSECGGSIYWIFCNKKCSYGYCPNCGAKMDGGADNGGENQD